MLTLNVVVTIVMFCVLWTCEFEYTIAFYSAYTYDFKICGKNKNVEKAINR